MNTAFVVAGLATIASPAQERPASGPHIELSYSTIAPSAPKPRYFKSPGGTPLKLSLVPDEDTDHHVLVLELQLQRARTRTDENLLDPPGDLHGIQVDEYVAADLAHSSMYPNPRTILVPSLRMELLIKTVNVKVVQVAESPGFAIQDLELEITPQPAFCNAATVIHIHAGQQLTVHKSPHSQSDAVDKLPNGTSVYTCDETQLWYRIFYSGPHASCAAGSPNGLPDTKTDDCNSGWVEKKFVSVTSG